MGKHPISRLAFVLILLSLACSLPIQFAPATATPASGNNLGGGSSGANRPPAATQKPTAAVTPTPSLSPTPTPTPTITPTPSPTPVVPSTGPYTVKQTRTLGGESISGLVCSITSPFDVTYNTPHVTFSTSYMPADAQHGNWTYSYYLPQPNESHDAKGNYTLSQPGDGGVLTLTMTGSDHVVFKGFDGNIPTYYTFNLVPETGAPCP